MGADHTAGRITMPDTARPRADTGAHPPAASAREGERMEHMIDVGDGFELWVDDHGGEGTPLVLVMGANASGLGWPDALVERLARHHRVIRYDHRDTGRSTWAFDQHPYAIRDLAGDVVTILDALGIDRAHVVGMSMGGTLVQLLLLDHPDRLRSATVLCTSALGAGLAAGEADSAPDLPDPAPELLELWTHLGDERTPDDELDFRVEHWRLLSGDELPFDADWFRRLERALMAHADRTDSPFAHALADQSGLDRGHELAAVAVPTLVIEAPADPINPPPHAAHLAAVIGGARLITIPGMGHALPPVVVDPSADAVLAHTTEVDSARADRRPDPSEPT